MVCARKFLVTKENARIVFTNSSCCQNDVDIFCGNEKLPPSKIAEIQGKELILGNFQEIPKSFSIKCEVSQRNSIMKMQILLRNILKAQLYLARLSSFSEISGNLPFSICFPVQSTEKLMLIFSPLDLSGNLTQRLDRMEIVPGTFLFFFNKVY